MRILFLDIDTLRPDHLSCYGYHRLTSPNIDRIAAEGVRFDNYYCSDAPCLPSRTALMTGRFGIHNGVVGHGGTCADLRIEGAERGFRDKLATTSLVGVFRWKGWRTVTISPFAERHSAWHFYAGFQEMYNTLGCGLESAEQITPTVLDWIERHGHEDKWFLHVNYWDPHTPYRAPTEFGNPFANDPLPAWLTPEVIAAHWNAVGPHTAQEFNMYDDATSSKYPRQPGQVKGMEGVRQVIDGYDCGVAYADFHVGQILEALRAKGVLHDTMIVVSSDHGENLGELGIYGEHGTCDNITHRIPLIIRMPGGMRGHVDRGLHYNLDLAPTLSALLGLTPASNWDGTSFAAAVRSGAECGRDYLVLSQCAHVCQRSVRYGPYIYIRTYHDGFHLFPEEMLYDLEHDPHEQTNLAPERPELCRQALYYLAEWHDRMMRSMCPYDTDPLWTVMREGGPYHARGQLKAYCERLQRTGRGWAIEELKRRHPYEFR
ncbi:MAG: sulfatase family protein [Kiritimatiellia bacterium]